MLRRLLWLVPVALLFWNLGYAGFWNPDEGRYAAASYEMAHPFGGGASDWLVPHLDTVPRLNKPPLVYWAMALSFRAWGVGEWSARLVPALASLLAMAVVALWGARVWGARAGWAGAMVWSSGVGAVAMGRTANTDMLLCASIALTLFGIFWAIESEGARREWMGALAGLGMGLALLSKGPVGVALPLAFAAIYLTLSRQWNRAPWGALALALGVALAIGAPWFVAVEARHPGFIKNFLGEENLKRFQGGAEYHKPTSPLYYLPVVLVGLMPWTGFLVPALGVWKRRAPDENGERSAPDENGERGALAGRAQLFLTVWALVLVAFFSVSSTKLISYVLPALPAFSLLVGVAVARWDGLTPGWKRVSIGLNLALYAVLLVALVAVPARDKVSKTWGFKPGVLLDNHIVPREVGAPWTWGLVALVVVFAAASLWALRRDGRTLLGVQSAGAIAVLVTLLGLAGTIARFEDGTHLVHQLAPSLRPDDRIGLYRAFLPGVIPIVRRPVSFFRFDNSSGLNESEVARSPFYSTQQDAEALQQWLDQPGRAFVLTEGLKDDALNSRLYLWGRTNDFFLLSNRPRPTDVTARLDFTSPDRRRQRTLRKTN